MESTDRWPRLDKYLQRRLHGQWSQCLLITGRIKETTIERTKHDAWKFTKDAEKPANWKFDKEELPNIVRRPGITNTQW